MDNALKFTPEGKITIGYEIEKEAIKYFVKDTGIGIPPERREEIFVKFRQLDERISREYGGIGIGLYLARRLTEVLKGKIWVEENTPHGSVFYVRIPVKITERSETNKQGQIIGNKPSEKESPIVLIAEDNPVSALLLKKILHNIGVESVLARNGLEAVQYIENRNPCDLILMDLNMPVMDGFEAIEKIKSIRGDLPIIIQTAYDSEYGRTKARELEVEDFINKPVNQEQLRKTVGKFIQVPFVSSGYLSSGT
jgi:CheY-like chemotaxis protein